MVVLPGAGKVRRFEIGGSFKRRVHCLVDGSHHTNHFPNDQISSIKTHFQQNYWTDLIIPVI